MSASSPEQSLDTHDSDAIVLVEQNLLSFYIQFELCTVAQSIAILLLLYIYIYLLYRKNIYAMMMMMMMKRKNLYYVKPNRTALIINFSFYVIAEWR